MNPDDPEWQAQVSLARRRLVALGRVGFDGYVESWFARDVLGPALELVSRHARGYRDGVSHLMIEMPTQVGKTLHTCLFSSQLLGQAPELHVQDCGYGEEFMVQTTGYVSGIGRSPGFLAAFPRVRLGAPRVKELHKAKRTVEGRTTDTTHQIDVLGLAAQDTVWKPTRGYFRARSVKGPVSGYPGDVMIMEDPYKGWDGEAGALSAGWNQRLINFYEGVFRRRLQGERSCEIHAYTPWTDTDIRIHVRRVWERKGVPYLVIKLPMLQREGVGDHDHERETLLMSRGALRGLARFLRVDPEAMRETMRLGGACRPYDKRAPGEALDPKGILPGGKTQAWVDSEKASMLARDLAALWDLAPRSDLVDRFPKHLWRPWDPTDEDATIEKMDLIAISVDPNGDETERGAFASMGVWGARRNPQPSPAKFPWLTYRMDELRDRPGYGSFCDMIERLALRWPEAKTIIIEATGHGQSAATDPNFRNRKAFKGREFVFVKPTESKPVRWDLMEVPLRQGCGHVPICSDAARRIRIDWVSDREDASVEDITRGDALGFLSEIAGAGRLLVKDRTDEAAQFFAWLREHGATRNAWDKLAGLRVPA